MQRSLPPRVLFGAWEEALATGRTAFHSKLFPEKFESLSFAVSKWTASDPPRENAQSKNRE